MAPGGIWNRLFAQDEVIRGTHIRILWNENGSLFDEFAASRVGSVLSSVLPHVGSQSREIHLCLQQLIFQFVVDLDRWWRLDLFDKRVPLKSNGSKKNRISRLTPNR